MMAVSSLNTGIRLVQTSIGTKVGRRLSSAWMGSIMSFVLGVNGLSSSCSMRKRPGILSPIDCICPCSVALVTHDCAAAVISNIALLTERGAPFQASATEQK
jgi:hypothetical protein